MVSEMVLSVEDENISNEREDMKRCMTQQCSFYDINTSHSCTQNIGSCQNYTTMKEEDMKRYNPRIVYPIDAIIDLDKCDTEFNEDPDGEWVRWEDIKGILQYKDQLKGYTLEPAGLKCNCEEMAEGEPLRIFPYFWICPVHGYKRR